MLPEKYYETCITCHIVRYFEQSRIGKIYPFTISQVQEKSYGYDFAYPLGNGHIFYIQFKRPNGLSVENSMMAWSVEMVQLETIIKNGIGSCTYYALPEFDDIFEWYSGLEKTCFISADDLYTQIRLKRKIRQHAVLINSKKWRLKRFGDYFPQEISFRNVLATDESEEPCDRKMKIPGENFRGFYLEYA